MIIRKGNNILPKTGFLRNEDTINRNCTNWLRRRLHPQPFPEATDVGVLPGRFSTIRILIMGGR